MVSDTLFVLLDIEKEEEASDKVEREDGSTIHGGPQASLPSAAQPAVMDIRRRRRRFLEIDVHNMLEIDEHYKHAKILLCICESSTKKENKERKEN